MSSLIFGGALVISATVGFSEGVNAFGVGLLGQVGFFDRVNVQMNYRKREFFIETDDQL
jgi:hypothetical protein